MVTSSRAAIGAPSIAVTTSPAQARGLARRTRIDLLHRRAAGARNAELARQLGVERHQRTPVHSGCSSPKRSEVVDHAPRPVGGDREADAVGALR